MSANALFYLSNPPFDILNDEERAYLAAHSHITYLDKDQALPAEWQDNVMIVIKGKLTQHNQDELIAGLRPNDWFLAKDKDGTPLQTIASEQTLLFVIDGKAIDSISTKNTALKHQLFADLSTKTAELATRSQVAENAQMLHLPIKELGKHIKTSGQLLASDTLFDAAVLMDKLDAKHTLVKDGERIGVITQTDICRAIANLIDMSEPVGNFAKFNLFTVNENHELSEALMTMLEKKVHRLPIVNDAGQIVGVLGQTELLNFLANHSALITWRIDNAHNFDELKAAVEMVGKFIKRQHQNGVKIHIIARAVQSLNAHIFAKAWGLIAPQSVIDNSCLIVMGSEGRGEQIMRTDQDNALIIKDGFVDDRLPQYATLFNDKLNELGYPYCTGGIMINNTIWRLPLSEFKAQVTSWLGSINGDNLIHFATLVDAHFVVGDIALLHDLQTHWHTALTQKSTAPNYLNRFAAPTVQMGSGAGFWQKFTGGADNDIDLKKAGIFPIVHGIRSLALEYGIQATNTRSRIASLKDKGVLDDKLAQNLTEALEFFLSKRLSVSLVVAEKSQKKVNPNTLSALERDLLKESLSVVKAFKAMITRHYRLDVFVG